MSKFTSVFLSELDLKSQKLDLDFSNMFSRAISFGFMNGSNIIKGWDSAPKNGFYLSTISQRTYLYYDDWNKFKEREREYRFHEDPPRNQVWQNKKIIWNILDTVWIDEEDSPEITFYLVTNINRGTKSLLAIRSDAPYMSIDVNLHEIKTMVGLLKTCLENPSSANKLHLPVFSYIYKIWNMLSTKEVLNGL